LNKIDIEWEDNAAVCVILASGGYPEKYQNGYEITGLDTVAAKEHTIVFHAGTKKQDGKIVTDGGRVLGVTGVGRNLDEAIKIAYQGVEIVNFDKKHFRTDIGIK
jgi:phosphoribosylamine--glycine ligase